MKQRVPLFVGVTAPNARETYERIGPFDEGYTTSEDHEYSLRLAAAGVPLLFYCIATARGWIASLLWSAALTMCAGALVLSRTRASWLALMAWGAAAFVLVVRGPSLFDVTGAKRRAQMIDDELQVRMARGLAPS